VGVHKGMTNYKATDVGKSVAYSALLPRTAAYFLDYFRANRASLVALLAQRPRIENQGNADESGRLDALNADLAFILFHLCYCSPEYGDGVVDARRWLPYPLDTRRQSNRAVRLQEYLAVRPWDRNVFAVNAAEISADWISGVSLRELEARFENLRGGMIIEMLRTAASQLSGLADILSATSTEISKSDDGAKILQFAPDTRGALRQLVRRVRQYALQAIVGVPEDVLWMMDVTSVDLQPLIQRSLAVALRQQGLSTIEDLLDKGRTDVFLRVLGNTPASRATMDRIRQAAQRVRLERTNTHQERILRRIDCDDLVKKFFAARDVPFEDCLKDCFDCLKIKIVARDDDRKRPRFPDFVIEISSGVELVIECKSTNNGNDVNLGDATDVGGKAAAHGLNNRHMVTVCQQYVGTDVPRQIEGATSLSVVNAEDLAVAMAYLKAGTISAGTFEDWISTPGQPRIDELFRR
jgi:hypothetical protein